MVTINLAELLDISARLNAAGCVPEIAADLSRLLDSVTVPDEAAQYLWTRMLKTGKTRFTRLEIYKLVDNSRILRNSEMTTEALNVLKEQGKISETRIYLHNHSKEICSLGRNVHEISLVWIPDRHISAFNPTDRRNGRIS